MNVRSSNEVYSAQNESGETVAVFKKSEMTKTLNRVLNEWDLFTMSRAMEGDGLMKRSVVTSDISRELGFDIVPDTVFAKSTQSDSLGSLQKYLKGYVTGDKANPEWIKKIQPKKAQEMFLLDTLLGMADRHTRNWMVNEAGDLKVIDTDHILYLRKNTRWQSETSMQRYFSGAFGKVDPDVAKSFLSLTPEALTLLLQKKDIPSSAIHYAVERLEGMQTDLQRGDSFESIVENFRILAPLNYANVTGTVVMGPGAAAILAQYWRVKSKISNRVRNPAAAPLVLALPRREAMHEDRHVSGARYAPTLDTAAWRWKAAAW